MKIDTLRHVLVIAKCGSISAAAERLYLNQTTLSAAIRAAENELGFPIFLRHSSGVRLTDEGRELARLASSIIDNYDQILSLGSPLHSLRLAMHPIACERLSIEVSSEFQRCLPDRSLSIIELPKREVVEAVHQGTFRYGVAYLTNEELSALQARQREDFFYQILLTDARYFYVNAASPLASKSVIQSAELGSLRLALSEKCQDQFFGSELESLFHHVSIFSNAHLVKRAVRDLGMCAFYMSDHEGDDWFCQGCSIKKLQIADVSPQVIHHVLICRSIDSLSKPEKVLLSCIRSAFRNSFTQQ